MPASSSPPAPDTTKSIALRAATRIQSISALSFSAFLVLHLAAPLGAAIGLDASQIMLPTREYYQTSFLEPILVWGSLIAHIASGIARSATLGKPKKAPSWHSIAGFVMVPVVAGHAWTHRILPARRGISPSFLSYQYVSYSLFSYPVTSWLAYAVLSVASTYHAASGLRMILSGRRKAARLPDGNVWRASYVAVVSGLGIGLLNLAGEGKDVPLWLGKRYAQVLKEAYLQ